RVLTGVEAQRFAELFKHLRGDRGWGANSRVSPRRRRSPGAALSAWVSGLRCEARNRGRTLASSPRWELAGHLYREVEVVDRDLLDVHAKRNRRMRLGGGRVEMRPQRVRDVQRRPSGRTSRGGKERLLRPRRYRRPQPDQELDTLVIRNRTTATDHGPRP